MSNRVGMLPNFTAETVRSWLLQVDKSRGPQDDRAVWVFKALNDEAENIIKKLKAGEGEREELVEELCQLRIKREQTKAALLLMLIAQMNFLQADGQAKGAQSTWQKSIDKLNKDIRDLGSKTAPFFTIDIDGFLFEDPTYKKILDTVADVLEGTKILALKGNRAMSELSSKEKMDLFRLSFDIVTRWAPNPLGKFGGFFKFYSDSMKEIGKKLEEIENHIKERLGKTIVTFEDIDFGEMLDAGKLQGAINSRVEKLTKSENGRKGLGPDLALEIVHAAAKVRLLKAYHAAAFGKKGLFNQLTVGDDLGKEIDRWAPISDCLQLRFREGADMALKENPSIYPKEGIENIIITTQKTTHDEEMLDRAKKSSATDKWAKEQDKRERENKEVIAGKVDVDTYCDKKPVWKIEELREKLKKHIKDLVEEAKQARTACMEKQRLAEAAREELVAARNASKSTIDELKARQKNALDQLRKKHVPKIEEWKQAAKELKESIKQTEKDAFWAITDRENKELSPLMDKALDADKEYFSFSEKYDPLRAASQQADLEYTNILLRSKKGEKVSEQELNTLKTKSEKLESEELQMRKTYNKLDSARNSAWENYNKKKVELESQKTKVQTDTEKLVKQMEKEADHLDEQINALQEKYDQEKSKLEQDQTNELNSIKDALRKKTEAKKLEFTKKSEAAKKVCEDADRKQKKVDNANEQIRRIDTHKERAKARKCVERILNEQMQSLLRSLEFVTKSERDIHSTLWSYRGLTKQEYANLPDANLKHKALVLSGKASALAKFIDAIYTRENKRTNFNSNLTRNTYFAFKPKPDLMKRLTQKVESPNLPQEHKDFRAVFDILDKEGLKKLQLVREHLMQELSLLKDELAACLDKLQVVEAELGRTDPELSTQWENILRDYEKKHIEKIKNIKSQERNQPLEKGIQDIVETVKDVIETFNKLRPKVPIDESIKQPGGELPAQMPGETISEVSKQVGETTSTKKPIRPGRKLIGIESPFPKGSVIEAIACIGISVMICGIVSVGSYIGGNRIIEAIRDASEPPPVVMQVTETLSPLVTVTNAPVEEVSSQDEDTPTPPPEEVMTEAEMDAILQECLTNLEEGKAQLIKHYEMEGGDCEAGIKDLKAAIESAAEILKIDPSNPYACLCSGLSRLSLEEGLKEAKEDLECAVAGLEGEEKEEAEQGLVDVTEMLSMPVCVEIETPYFGEDWYGDQWFNENPTFHNVEEVWASFEIDNPCGERLVFRWKKNNEPACQVPIEEIEDGWTVIGSGWEAEEGEKWIESATYCVDVVAADDVLATGCFEAINEEEP